MGRGPIVSYFCRFWDFENFYKCLTFQGGQKTLFSLKCPNNGLVSKENTLFFSITIGGGQNFFSKGSFILAAGNPRPMSGGNSQLKNAKC